MSENPVRQSAFFTLRCVAAVCLCLVGSSLAALGLAESPRGIAQSSATKNRSVANRNAPHGSLIAITQSATTSAPSGPGWSLITSPNALTTNNVVDGVISDAACFGTTNCFAVGDYLNGNNYQTLIEHWNGGSWSIITSPNVSATQNNHLSGVTCISATQCFAVGAYVKPSANGSFYQTLIEQWDGTSWSIMPSPNVNTDTTVSNQLTSVTCTSATNCFAAGYYANGIYYPGTFYQTLIEHWDGMSWSIVPSPNGSVTHDNYLNSVTCTSATECFAVGSNADDRTGISQTLIERWDGSSWTIVASPNRNSWNRLYGVTCTSSTSCFAVGFNNDNSYGNPQTLIEQWNGSSWSIVASPNPSTLKDYLFSVACTSSAQCFAVGYYGNGADYAEQTLIKQWDGSAWSVYASPNSSTATTDLFSVTCGTSTQCFAVGRYQTSTSGDRTLIEQWNGSSWSILTSPASQTTNNRLNNVSCPAATNCFAVGDYFNGNNYQTLIEHWNGTSWSIVPSPNFGALLDNQLYGVTCTSATQCFAVGFYSNGYSNRTLIERWDGTSWSIVPSPNSALGSGTLDDLYSVTCTSATDCFAVGYYYDGSYYKTLIEHWDGTSWSIVTSANSSTTPENYLYGVTCISAMDCFAVGNHGYYSAGGYALIEHWDGTSWSIVADPNTPNTYLYGVKCTSATQCFAVGYYGSSSVYQTLIEQWNGSAWSVLASPNTSATEPNVLYGIDCMSASDCWTAGYHGATQAANQTLTQHWDGTAWSIVPSAGPGGSFLVRVACLSGLQCWAVGTGRINVNSYSYDQTLIEEYSPTIPASIGVVSRMTHSPAGAFDVDLPLIGKRGVECRSGGANGNYSVVFSFVNDVTNCGSTATPGGTVVAGPNSNQCTENLTGVTNAQYISVELDNVVDSQNNTGNVAVPMGVLLGDVNGSGVVDGNDVSAVQAQTRQPVASANFREDVNANGVIDGNDVSLTQSYTRTSLPTAP